MHRSIPARRLRTVAVLAAVVTSAAVLAGCSSGPGDGSQTIKVVYEEQSPSTTRSDIMKSAAKEFKKSHPGVTIQAVPVNADDADYLTKLSLMERSKSTAPTIFLLDSFQIDSQATAGYAAPLDSYVSKWGDWTSQFQATARKISQAQDGKTYGIPITGGVIGLWYDKTLFQKAGLPTDWQPKTWADVISAAEAIKASSPKVTPFAAQVTKADGEGTTFQTIEVLLQGTPGGLDKSLYDPSTKKWVTGGQGMTDSLNFVQQLQSKDLQASASDLQSPNLGGLMGQWFPEHKVGIALTGNWLNGSWATGAASAWPDWKTQMGWTAMPTENGDAPGTASMTGGWVWSMSSTAPDKKVAFDFMKLITNKENSITYDAGTGNMPVRKDVAADSHFTSDPALQYFFGVADVAGIRPGLPEYPQVSTAISVASEAVATGASTPSQAASAYDAAVKKIVASSGQ